jgi:hypothetical protein
VLLAPLPALAEEPACRSSADCKEGTACDEGKCIPLGPRIILPPFYYRSADKQVEMFGLLYWRKKPSAEGRTRVFFPLYWHFDDRTLHVKHTILGPMHWRSAVGEANTRFYPLFFYTDYAQRGSSLTIVPLLHRSNVDGKALTIFPLGFWRSHQRTGYAQGLIVPYYFRRAGGKRTDVFFPLFVAKSSKDHAFEWMLPLNFYWRTKERRSLLLFPLAFHRSDVRERVLFTLIPPMVYTRQDPAPPSALGRPRGVEQRFFTLFPVFWYQRSGRSTFGLLPPVFHRGHPDGHHSGIFPILWFGRDKQERHAVLFPIYWHFSKDKSGFTLAGLLAFHRRRETGHSSGLVPIAFFGEDRKKGTSYKLILPLFYRGTEAHGRQSTTVVLPLLWWTRDEDAGLRRQVLVLNYFHRRDRARSIDAFVPLFLRWRNEDTGSTTWAVPLFVHHDDPDSNTTVLFPFYVGFFDKRERASGGLALGIFYWSRAPDSSTHVLFPLIYSSKRGGERRFVGFPLVWHFSSERERWRTTLVGPFYSVRDREGSSWGLAPIFLAGDRDGTSHQIVPPIFAHVRDRKEGWNVWVLGPAFSVSTKHGWTAGLFPVAWFGSGPGRSTRVVPPLLYAHLRTPRSETLWIGPWVDSHEWDDRRQEHRLRMAFPLYFHTIAPTRFGSRETHTLLPLLHSSRDPRRSWLVTPIGGYRRDHATRSETGVWGLYAWHKSPTVDGRALLPFWLRVTDSRDRSRTTVLFPLWVGFRAPGRSADVVFPLVWHFREPDETDFVVFPVYFGIRRADRSDDVDVAFPLVWNFRSPKRSLWVVPPVYWRNGPDGGGAFGLVPLVFSADSRERFYFVFFPLVWHFDDKVERRARRFYGLGYYHNDVKGWSAGLFPLLFWNRHQDSAHSVIFPVFWQFVDRKADTRTTFVTLFFHRKKASYTTVGLAPIFWTTSDRAGGFSLTLLPLFHYRNRVDSFRLWTLPLGYCNDGTVRQGWFVPYYGRRDPTRTVDWAMPLFLRWHDRALRRTTWLIPPLLAYSRSDPFTRTDTALLLFWHVKRIDGRNTVLFPLYWDFHSYEARRTTVVFPLFFRFADRSTRRTTWIVPPLLLGGTSHPHGNDVTWFPLLWRAQQRDEGYTVFFPLYWDFWRGRTRTTVVFPLGFRADRAATETWLVLNTFVRLYKKTDGYQVMFLPIFEWARERPQDLRWEVVLGLVGYERVGRERYLKVLWIPFRMQSPAPGRMAWFESGRRQAAWVR